MSWIMPLLASVVLAIIFPFFYMRMVLIPREFNKVCIPREHLDSILPLAWEAPDIRRYLAYSWVIRLVVLAVAAIVVNMVGGKTATLDMKWAGVLFYAAFPFHTAALPKDSSPQVPQFVKYLISIDLDALLLGSLGEKTVAKRTRPLLERLELDGTSIQDRTDELVRNDGERSIELVFEIFRKALPKEIPASVIAKCEQSRSPTRKVNTLLFVLGGTERFEEFYGLIHDRIYVRRGIPVVECRECTNWAEIGGDTGRGHCTSHYRTSDVVRSQDGTSEIEFIPREPPIKRCPDFHPREMTEKG